MFVAAALTELSEDLSRLQRQWRHW